MYSWSSAHLSGWSVMLLSVVLVWFGIAVMTLSMQPSPSHDLVEVVVQPGDTLWSLARQYAPGMDPREAVYIIRTVNDGLDPALIRPGDVVLVPREVTEGDSGGEYHQAAAR